MSDVKQLSREFDREVYTYVEIAKRDYGYNPNRFMRMFGDLGGVGTAKRLIAKEEESDGFRTLLMFGRLDLTVEALATKDKYACLFTEDELRICNERLQRAGYIRK